MSSIVKMEGNQTKLGIQLKGHSRTSRVKFMAPVSHSILLSKQQCPLVSLSESTLFFLCTCTSLFIGVPGNWAVTVALKGVALRSRLTHLLGSDSSFSGEENWVVSSGAPFSPQEREEGKGHCYRGISCHPSGHLVPRST